MKNRESEKNPVKVMQGSEQAISDNDTAIDLNPTVKPESAKADPIHEEVKHMGTFDPTKTLKTSAPAKIDVKQANFWYGAKQALTNISMPLLEGQVTALI